MHRVDRCNDMASLGFSRKRSHEELDDGDECLPISKRINSLHIEGQSTAGLQVGHTSALTENNQDGFPCMSSEVYNNNPRPGCSDFNVASGPLQPRHSGIPRLPRIDEHVYHQGVEAFQNENQFGSSMDQENQNLSYIDQQNYSQAVPSSAFLYNGSGQLSSSFQNSLHSHNNNQSFPVHDSNASNHPSTGQSPFFLPQPSQRPAHHDQSHCHHHNVSPQDNSRQPHQHYPFPNHEQHSNAVASMESQQDFECSSAVADSYHHQQQLQQIEHRTTPLTNNHVIPQEANVDSNSGLSYEEPPIDDDRSDFQREQLPSGNYEPELGRRENPFYFSVNQMLYEAHVSKVRRMNQFHGES
ncbi:hypothetical protein ElyMa_000224600 [Elysia marginata]|uniref:Uncharacterized protein n=1 Tax=Elysia marginata TaxID=1093978 RepID=A0AAV4EZV9_9GAST|nr:hypothetical protein ElyMa_000224600 [Elysia marginata]